MALPYFWIRFVFVLLRLSYGLAVIDRDFFASWSKTGRSVTPSAAKACWFINTINYVNKAVNSFFS